MMTLKHEKFSDAEDKSSVILPNNQSTNENSFPAAHRVITGCENHRSYLSNKSLNESKGAVIS